jgi:SNF2-related domain/Bromodomain
LNSPNTPVTILATEKIARLLSDVLRFCKNLRKIYTMNSSLSDIAHDESGEEVGFLLMEDSDLIFDHPGLARNVWLDVEFRDVEFLDQEDMDFCLRGSVILGSDDSIDGGKQLYVMNSTRFDGTISDVPHSPRCPSCCTSRQTNRSDSSLFLGLAMTCQDQGHIRIETIQVMLRITAEASDHATYDEPFPGRVSFLITFSMPSLDHKKTRGKQKAMPPSTQLLFSLMRSDWEYLSSSMRSDYVQKFQSDGTLRKDSLFPSKMSLEELYSRMRGLQNQQGNVSIRKQASPFSALPLEVIQEKIAPFLSARSLNSWRCTCVELHQALKAVVPGLKLILYDHQIRSLEWMRERETQAWSEKDVLGCQISPLSFDGDCHRCVTGGATVMLRTRRAPRKVWRLDTQYGRVFNDFQFNQVSSCLSRKVARGGLLCDDPGLGKTITVLALILQTLGLSSEEISPAEDDESKAEFSETTIFYAYWREQVDPIYQRQDLNRLTRLTQRRDGGSIFLYPVSSEAYPDYYDVIERPMCFRAILKNIADDKYGHDFSMYEKDVELIFQNAIDYNAEDGDVADLARDMWADFKDLVAELKTRKIQSARKSFSNSKARPNSSVAAILEQKNRTTFMRSLLPSAANLVVVPETLISHWVVS